MLKLARVTAGFFMASEKYMMVSNRTITIIKNILVVSVMTSLSSARLALGSAGNG